MQKGYIFVPTNKRIINIIKQKTMTNTRQVATAYRNAKQALNNFRANGGDRHSAEYMMLMENVEGFRNECIHALTITANFTKENAVLVFAEKTNEILTLMHDYNKDLD